MKDYKFRWVHLSDIHFAYINSQTNRIRARLIDLLREKRNERSIDCLFITGDITDKSKEYSAELKEFLKDVLLAVNIQPQNVFLVPGNHDIQRSDKRSEILSKIYSSDDVYHAIEYIEEDSLKVLLDSQKKYWDFYQEFKGINTEGLNKIHFIEKGNGFNVLHLNTSWLCRDDESERNLHIGIDRLTNCLLEAKLPPDDINFAIGHHCFDWLAQLDQTQIRTLFKDHNIDFYLSGHVHQSMVSYDNFIDTHYCVCRQMRVDDYESGGMIIGDINTLSGGNRLFFFTWKKGGYWAIDNEVGPEASNGVFKLYEKKFSSLCSKEKPIIIVHKTMYLRENISKLKNDMGLIDAQEFVYPYSSIEISTPQEWLEHKDQTAGFIKAIIEELEDNTLHIFPLSQIPLLIYMGYLIGNGNNNIKIYQFNQEDKWVSDGPNDSEIVIDSTFCGNSGSKSLSVLVEISSNIRDEDVAEILPLDSSSMLRVFINEPGRKRALYSADVKKIKSFFFEQMEKYYAQYEVIHLFYAGPAGLAVEIGRCIQKNMWPTVALYHYRRNSTPKYTHAFNINS